MSLYSNDYLVSTRQADMRREAADARLAKAAMAGSSARKDRRPGMLTRALTGFLAVMHPVRRAATHAVRSSTQTTPATGIPRT